MDLTWNKWENAYSSLSVAVYDFCGFKSTITLADLEATV